MNYTIVWNENKTEGIILSSENFSTDVEFAKANEECGWYSTLANEFRSIYGAHEPCTSVSLSEPTKEMLEAGYEELCSSGEPSVERIYKAMIQKLTCNL